MKQMKKPIAFVLTLVLALGIWTGAIPAVPGMAELGALEVHAEGEPYTYTVADLTNLITQVETNGGTVETNQDIEELGVNDQSGTIINIPANTTITLSGVLSTTGAIKIVGADKATVQLKRGFTGDALSMISATGGGMIALENLTIDGQETRGKTIFEIASISSKGIVRNCDIKKGRTSSSTAGYSGAISSLGELTVTDVTITDCKNIFGSSGGIYTAGTTNITNTIISDSSAKYSGGGIYSSGGTVNITGTSITDCAAGGDYAGNGGGIYCSGGSVTINATDIRRCTAGGTGAGKGGGIYFEGTVTANITNTTIANCNSQGDGGGIWNKGKTTATKLVITNCNANGGNKGGGIEVWNGSLSLSGASITGNTATIATAGGGVDCGNTFTSINLAGKVIINNNTTSPSSVANDCWFSGNPAIESTSRYLTSVSALTAGSSIGILGTRTYDEQFTQPDDSINDTIKSYFFANDPYKGIVLSGTALKLGKAAYTTPVAATATIKTNKEDAQTGSIPLSSFTGLPTVGTSTIKEISSSTNPDSLIDSIEIVGGAVSYSSIANIDQVGITETFTVTISSTIYQDITATLTFTSVDKETVTPYVPSVNDGGSSGTNVPVLVDGKEVNIGKVTTKDGTATVTVDQKALDTQIATAHDSIVIPVATIADTNIVVAQLVVKNIEDVAAKDMTLSVQVGNISYDLPAAALDTKALMEQFGTNDPAKVPISIEISTKVDSATAAKVEASVKKLGGEIVIPAVEFHITANYEGKKVEVDTFNSYVGRTMEITPEQAKKITTAIVVESDKRTRHVPTKVYEKDGKWYAEINSRTNSTYVLINKKVSFNDIKGKSYESMAKELSARKIMTGFAANGEKTFGGEKKITNSGLALVLVRALGLPENGNYSVFKNVTQETKYAGALGTAYEYGIITKGEAAKFVPGAKISRQDAMAMVARAAKVANYKGKSVSVAAYSDASLIKKENLSGVKFCVGSGLDKGAKGKLRPTEYITRAEAGSMVLKLLQKAKLI